MKSASFLCLFIASTSFSSICGEDVPLRALVLFSGEENLIRDRKELEELEGFIVCNLQLPGTEKELFYLEKELFSSEKIDSETIAYFKELIQQYYRKQGYSWTFLEVPQQPLDVGVVQIQITQMVLDSIEIVGNDRIPSAWIERNISLQIGEPIDFTSLVSSLQYLNRNPFRKVDALFRPGSSPYSTEMIVEIEEKSPYRVYAGTDNTGTQFTHEGRMYAGAVWGDMLGKNSVLLCQYTAAYNIYSFQAISADWHYYLPNRDVLYFYGGYSQVHAHLAYPNKRNDGENYQISGRYKIFRSYVEPWHPEISFGFDFKGLNNNLEFVENYPRFTSLVNVTEFAIGGEFHREFPHSELELQADIYFSPGKLISHQENVNFSNLRPGAKNHWVYGRFLCNQKWKIPGHCLFFLNLQAQLSSNKLIPSEQLGIGGYNTVRGYDERELNVDSGIIGNLEFRSPSWKVITQLRNRKIQDALQLLIFADGGWGVNYQKVPESAKSNYLIGVGPGIRYTFDSYLTARLDWGIQLHREAQLQPSWSKLHFGFSASY